jgi:glycosyltransferase involved in cell wall biosynthesis
MKQHVTVVGQTPPPLGGQAVMLQLMLDGTYTDVELHHVRMAFSKELAAVGRFQLDKIAELGRVIVGVWASRLRHRSTILYYPPSGPSKLPLARDVAILLATRWLFPRTVFHFHASGLSAYLRTLPAPVRKVAMLALRRPSAAIRIAPSAPDEGRALGARLGFVVPNGIRGIDRSARSADADEQVPSIVFMGLVNEGKGSMRVLETAARLRAAGRRFVVRMAGEIESPEYGARLRAFIAEHDLEDSVEFVGVVSGRAKDELFANASVFLFLTRFESETFPTVILEAMSAEVAVVASDWRGIPDMVENGTSGILVPEGDPTAAAEAIARLFDDPGTRDRVAAAGRRRFEQRYTLGQYQSGLDQVFSRVATTVKENR